MAGLGLEARTIELSRDSDLATSFVRAEEGYQRLEEQFPPDLSDERDSMVQWYIFNRALVKKVRDAVVNTEGSAAVELDEKEIDHLNEAFIGSINAWQADEKMLASLEEMGVDKNTRIQMLQEKPKSIAGNLAFLNDLNLAWNRAGGTPRPTYREFIKDVSPT